MLLTRTRDRLRSYKQPLLRPPPPTIAPSLEPALSRLAVPPDISKSCPPVSQQRHERVQEPRERAMELTLERTPQRAQPAQFMFLCGGNRPDSILDSHNLFRLAGFS